MSDAGSPDTDARAMVRPKLWGVIVTFRRPEVLRVMLTRIQEQTMVPDHLLVVDNGSDPAARRAAEEAGAEYVDSGDNIGPAGGIALGMERILEQAGENDWLVLFDDDDPPTRSDMLSELWNFATACIAKEDRAGGVGVVGARYDRRRGVFRRVPDKDLRGAVPVDYIGGGQFPIYSFEAIRACGIFDRDYFFGFDDAEYGLRLRGAGYSLFAHGEVWQQQRAENGRLNLDKSALRTADESSSWRRYYAVRNITLIARQYGAPLTPLLVACGSGARATIAQARAKRPLKDLVLPMRGALHGLLGRVGRTVDPGSGEKTG